MWSLYAFFNEKMSLVPKYMDKFSNIGVIENIDTSIPWFQFLPQAQVDFGSCKFSDIKQI